MSDATDLVEIRILGMSLDAFRHSSEHHDELFREFALMHSRAPEDVHGVPARLAALVAELDGQYSGFTAIPQGELDAALARDDETVDLVYQLPKAVGPACRHFADLLREADEFCRVGELLTVVPSSDAIAFRDWFLEEFVRQADGEPPMSWPEYVAKYRG
jgi:hypothetical protein